MRCIESLEPRRLLASVPTGFSDALFTSGLNNPTAMEIAPDGRIFVAEQGGNLRVISTSGQLQAAPFVSVPVNTSGERGLLGVAIDPNFASNKFFYVYYTAVSPTIHNRVSRFTANGNVAVAGSEKVLLELPTLTAAFHNGGAIHFGPDGNLYIGVGENVQPANAQNLASLLGKILRINSDGSIPTDNPFYDRTSGSLRSIWALGLRNPFTFAFQPGTGKMFINDVGQITFEEINLGVAGSNYGWPNSEGPKKSTDAPSVVGTYRDPIFWYGRTIGNVIAGGTFYNPAHTQFPASYVGRYFFEDNGASWIHTINPNSPTVASDFASGAVNPVDLKVGAGGALYYLQRGNGQLRRITYTSIGGTVFNDADGDGVRDAGESAIAGRLVYIDSNGNGIADGGEQSDITDSNGLYVLGGLSAGTYIVRQQGPAGFKPTNPRGSLNFTLTTGQAAGGNFALTPFTPPTGGAGTVTSIAVYDDGVFRFNNGIAPIAYGLAGDTPVVGDWNGDGISDVGVRRGSAFALDSNGNKFFDNGDATFAFGFASDKPVAGKWKGGASDQIGIFRNGTWWLDANGDRIAGAGDITFSFGLAGDTPIAGDWNGDGITDVGVRRGNAFALDFNGDHLFSPGDVTFSFGLANDVPVILPGEPPSAIARVGVFRSGTFWLDTNGDRNFGTGDQAFVFGESDDVPLVGRFRP